MEKIMICGNVERAAHTAADEEQLKAKGYKEVKKPVAKVKGRVMNDGNRKD